MYNVLLALLYYLLEKKVVFCGHCGAVEVYISETETECPACDNTGIEKSFH